MNQFLSLQSQIIIILSKTDIIPLTHNLMWSFNSRETKVSIQPVGENPSINKVKNRQVSLTFVPFMDITN